MVRVGLLGSLSLSLQGLRTSLVIPFIEIRLVSVDFLDDLRDFVWVPTSFLQYDVDMISARFLPSLRLHLDTTKVTLYLALPEYLLNYLRSNNKRFVTRARKRKSLPF